MRACPSDPLTNNQDKSVRPVSLPQMLYVLVLGFIFFRDMLEHDLGLMMYLMMMCFTWLIANRREMLS